MCLSDQSWITPTVIVASVAAFAAVLSAGFSYLSFSSLRKTNHIARSTLLAPYFVEAMRFVQILDSNKPINSQDQDNADKALRTLALILKDRNLSQFQSNFLNEVAYRGFVVSTNYGFTESHPENIKKVIQLLDSLANKFL